MMNEIQEMHAEVNLLHDKGIRAKCAKIVTKAEDIFKEPLKGLNIQVVGNKTIYNEVNVLSAEFDTKRYFYPIPYSEVIKNGNMIQNPNW